MVNGLKGTHIATGIPVEINLNGKEMQLAMCMGDHINECWEMMNASVLSRGECGVIGQVEVDAIVIHGVSTWYSMVSLRNSTRQ